jgi:vacuolar-type H+-ATPase subunit I/STV1
MPTWDDWKIFPLNQFKWTCITIGIYIYIHSFSYIRKWTYIYKLMFMLKSNYVIFFNIHHIFKDFSIIQRETIIKRHHRNFATMIHLNTKLRKYHVANMSCNLSMKQPMVWQVEVCKQSFFSLKTQN